MADQTLMSSLSSSVTCFRHFPVMPLPARLAEAISGRSWLPRSDATEIATSRFGAFAPPPGEKVELHVVRDQAVYSLATHVTGIDGDRSGS
jgi:hypothetical protein